MHKRAFTEWERWFSLPNSQVIVVHRYDDPDAYGIQVTLWPDTRHPDIALPITIGLIDAPLCEGLRRDLLANGFPEYYSFIDLPDNAYQAYIIRQVVPLEWKSRLDVMRARVEVYATPNSFS